MKDSTESDIKYGEPFVFIQRGVKLNRFFKIKECAEEECTNQVTAKIKYYADRSYLISDAKFNQTDYCCKSCAGRATGKKTQRELREKEQNMIKNQDIFNRFLYPSIKKPINEYQALAYVEPIR